MTNEILFVLIGIGLILLGVAAEAPPPAGRLMRIVAAVLGLVVLLVALLR